MFATILLSSALALGGVNQPLKDIQVKEGVTPKFRKKTFAVTEAQYDQKTTSIADAKAYLASHGSEFTEITLTNVDDDLLQTVKDHCPNLKAFAIASSYLLEHLTDAGMQTIATFPQLTSLSFDAFWAINVSYDGIEAMLNGQTNVEALSLAIGNDHILSLIGQYSNLKCFNFTSYDVTSSGLEAFIQSSTLVSTLTALNLDVDPVAFTDAFVQGLAKYMQLSELSLNGSWSATTDNVVALFQALTNLTKLELAGLAIRSAHVAPIGQMQNLTTLALTNCSKLAHNRDYKTLFTNLTNLQVLTLGKATGFTYEQCHLIAKLPLKALSLSDTLLYDDGLEKLCNSSTLQQSLESLMLINEESIDNSGFGPLQKLSLKTLCLEHCPWFNDTSMQLIMTGNLANSLEALELQKVYISDATIHTLEHCPKLNTLMFVRNNAVTEEGMKTLLQLTPLHKSIKHLYLAEVIITSEMVPLFGAYENIESLLIGDALDFNIFTDGDALFKLPNIKQNHTLTAVFLGPLTTWDDFVHW